MEETRTFCQQLIDLSSRQFTCSPGTLFEGVFSRETNNCAATPSLLPYLARNDFFVFLKMKETLRGRQFDDTDDIRSNKTAALKASEETISKIVSKG
jgi:hypothetical protein